MPHCPVQASCFKTNQKILDIRILENTKLLDNAFIHSQYNYAPLIWMFCNLRRGPILFIPPARSTIYGTNSVHFCGSLIWNKLPNLVKSSRSISEFINIIKKIGNIDCGCMICSRWHTLSQFPRTSRTSLCSFRSCRHQSPDTLL